MLLTTRHIAQTFSVGYDATGRPCGRKAQGGFEQLTERDIRGNVSRWQAAGISQRLLYGDNGPYISFAGRVIAKITEAPGGGERRYDYAYSPLGFLTRADFSDSARPTADYSTAYEYDRQANLTKIVRHGTAFGALRGSSTLEITLEGNRVLSTSAKSDIVHLETAPSLGGFGGGVVPELSRTRRYDADGNLTFDPSRRISHIAYNDAGRPQSVTFSSGDRIRYVYSAAGRKLAERQLSADGLSDRTRRWVGGYEITVDGNGGLSTVQGRRLLLPQGYVDIKAYVNLDGTPVYSLHLYVADVQGNVVGLYDCSARALEQFTDYYPYGAPHPDATEADRQRRKFGGKELLSELGLAEYDFDARRLLSAVGSFSQPDPLAGALTDPQTGDRLATPYLTQISPYAYCAADPVNLIDPTGMDVYQVYEDGHVNVIENDNYDLIEMVDNNGTPKIDENGDPISIEFEYNTINYKEKKDKYGNPYFSITVSGDKLGKAIFEFLSLNASPISYVEFSLAQTGSTINGKNYINCGYMRGKEPGISDLLLKKLQYLKHGQLRNIFHTHPLDDKPGGGDKKFKLGVKRISQNTLHYIYLVKDINHPRYIRF